MQSPTFRLYHFYNIFPQNSRKTWNFFNDSKSCTWFINLFFLWHCEENEKFILSLVIHLKIWTSTTNFSQENTSKHIARILAIIVLSILSINYYLKIMEKFTHFLQEFQCKLKSVFFNNNFYNFVILWATFLTTQKNFYQKLHQLFDELNSEDYEFIEFTKFWENR